VNAVLQRCADRLRWLRFNWADPAQFIAERDAIARAIELEAAGQRQDAAAPNFFRASDPPPDPRTRRLVALAAFQAGEIARLQGLLAQAARPRTRRRRHEVDHRQLALML
jgi:hypothetical protein